METVALDDFFAARDGLTILRPESRYERRPALLVNAEATRAINRNGYLRNRPGRTPPEGVAVFHDVTIFGPGVMRLDDGRLLAESLEDPRRRPPEYPASAAVRTINTGVHVAKRASSNYGHFLVEMLPRLVLNAEAYPADVPILLHRASRRFALPMLEVAGIDKERVAWIDDEPVRVRTLYWPTRNTFHPLDNSPHIFPFLRSLAPRAAKGSAGRRLFVARRDAGTRQLLNDADVFAVLAPHGFEDVAPGRMSFREQMQVFAEARVVVGVAGAALTNIVFMPPGGTVVMLTPVPMAGWFFWDVASHCDLELVVVWGDARDRRGSKSIDFHVDPESIVPFLNGVPTR
jgi:hypothetical protein